MSRTKILPLLLLTLAAGSCGEGAVDELMLPDGEAAFLISDATHLPGRAGFYFRPPMVPDASPFPGTFDPNLSPEVRICILPACTTVIKTFNSSSAGAEKLTVDVAGESYNALWNTKNHPGNLTLGKDIYRLEVWVGTARLGYADLWFVNNSKGLKDVTDAYVGVVKGSTLTIKFRIETGVIGTIVVTPNPASILIGETRQFSALALDLYDVPLAPQPAFTWSSTMPAVATVNASGLATGVAAGTASIQASAGGATGSATLNVVKKPLLMDDDYETNANTTLTVPDGATDVLANDDLGMPAGTLTSFGGGSLGGTVTDNLPGATVNFAQGSLTLNANGSLTYVPATGFTGIVMFHYRVTNLVPNGFDDAAVMIEVIATDPVLADDAFTTTTATTLSGNLFADNGSGADNLGVPAGTLTSFGGGSLGGVVTGNAAGASVALAGGTLTVNANGSFSLVNPSVTGTFTFDYRVTNLSGSDDATVTIMIQMAPDAKNDAFTAQIGVPVIGDVFADNGSGPDHRGAPLADVASFGGGSLPGDASTNAAGASVAFAGGTLSLAANGMLSLTGTTQQGTFTFHYRLTNAAGSDDATVTITLQSTPEAKADAFAVNTGATLNGDVNDDNGSGADVLGAPPATVVSFGGGSLGGSVTDNAAGASVSLAGGTLTLNADGSLTLATPTTSGTFTFQYRLQNPAGFSDATVTITVRAAPTAQPDAFTMMPSTTLNGNLFADNGSGADDLAFPAATLTHFGGGSLGGAVTDNVAGDDVALAGGTLTVNADGTFSLANPTATGTHTFQYRIANVAGTSDATVTIEVARPPDAINDAFTGQAGTNLNGDLTADNGSGADDLGAPPATLTHFGGGSLGGAVTDNAAGASVALAGGTLTVNANGTFTLNGTTQGGIFTFLYRLTNSAGTDDAAVMITLTAPPTANDDAPGANSAPGDAFHTALNTTLTGPSGNTPNLLANDVRGFPLADIASFGGGSAGGTVADNAAGSTVNATDGSITVNADGTFTFSPTTGFTGLFTFSYRLTNTAGSDDADVTIAVGVRPVAVNDTYDQTLVGNISVNTATGTPFTVSTNDAGDARILALVGGSATNGEATLNANGTFTFNPAAGFRGGNGTFQYTVTNGFGTSPAATVTVPVGAAVLWFVNNGAAACTTLASGCGRLSNPFSTLAAFQAINNGTGSNPADNHAIFVYQSSTGYTGGLTLRAGQRLIGQDATETLLSLTGVTLPSHSPALPAMNSGDGTTTAFSGATGGIALNSGNRLHGFTAAPSTGAGVSGASVGSLFVRDVAVNTASGPAVDLGSGTVDVIFTGVSSATSATRNINLSAIEGSVDLGGGALAGSTGEAFRINGGNAIVNYTGSITNASGKSVSISGMTGGIVTLSGSIGDTGTGIDLTNNTGAAVNFSGTLTLNTGANVAFNATGGGTVSTTNTASTLITTTASALNVANTTIGSGNLVFRSISAGTGASGPANGIVLNSTGTSGGLTVTGTGSAGTGGTIQRATVDGISLATTRNVSLSWMVVTLSGDDGIDGSSVTNFTLANSSVTNNGNAANEEGINFSNLSGTVALTNVTATGNAYHNLRIDNTSGTTSSLSITGGSYSNNQAGIGNHGILIEPRGTSQITTATVSGATISGNEVMGIQVATADQAVVSAFNVTGNTIQNNELGIDFSKAQTSSLTFSITNNLAMTGQNSHGINLFTAVGAGTTGSFRGRIENNTIGNAAVDGSGSVIGNCIRVNINGDADADVLINNNTIRECPVGHGIEVIGRNGTGGLDITITNNDVDHTNLTFNPGTSDFPLAAILVQSNCVNICNTVRADVRGNTVPAGSAFDFTTGHITLIESSGAPNPPGAMSVLELVDTAPASASCVAQLGSVNTGSVGVSGGCALIAGPINTPP